MIKLKDILLENTAPDIFIPRRTEDRIERLIKQYIRNGSQGNLNLSYMNLTVLPEVLKNVSVDGDFDCSNNKLTSLTGAPTSVGGTFNCTTNKLTSLKGSPVNVGVDFWCDSNKLTSLEGSPSSVGRHFSCNYNKLTSLAGAPKTVGGNFYCSYNTVQFTNAQVRAVCDVKRYIIV